MSSTGCLRIFACLFLSSVGGVSGYITNGPSNAVAEVGQGTVLNCISDTTLQNWALTSKREDLGTSSVQNIAINCVIQSGFTTHYEVERPGGSSNECSLIVKDITMQQAGVYTCTDIAYGPSALLTVIDSAPNITYNNTPNVMEGENVVITCSLNYKGTVEPAPTLRPHFFWTDYTGNNASNVYNPPLTNNSIVSQLTVKAGREDIMPRICHVYLQLMPSVTVGYAANTPTVNISASSQTIAVLYSPGDISIASTVSTADNCVYKPESLTCTADANPPAQYSWLDLGNNATTDDAIIHITSGGQYQCSAFNTIRSQTYIDKKVSNETTCYPPHNLKINGLSCSNDSTCTCSGNQTLVMMTCSADGFPIPSFHWRSDVRGDLGVGETIEAPYDGNYSCTGTNVFGNQSYSDADSIRVYSCQEPPAEIDTTLSSFTGAATPMPMPKSTDASIVGPIVGAVIGVIVILNGVATGLFFWYYKRVQVSHSGKMERNNKLRLDRKFSWLKKMMPCLSDTKESTGSNCLWVSLFLLLGIVTGIVTFPILILLANKYEKNNETSALNRRENGEGNGSGENGRGPTNISLANHSQPPPTNQMNAIRQEDPYQNESSPEKIELNISLRSRTQLLSDSPPSRPPPAGRPPPPPNKPTMNLSTNRSKDYAVNDQTQASNPEHTTYADLPFVQRDTLPTATPVQFLNVSNDTYASLNKT